MNTRISKIKIALEQLSEDLLTFSDDIWLSIDHNDSEALDFGYRLKKDYNEQVDTFSKVVQNIGSTLAQLENISILNDSNTPIYDPGHEGKENKTFQYNENQAHSINEDFCYKRPCGMKLENQIYERLNTWKAIYRTTIKHLSHKSPDIFNQLSESGLAKGRRKDKVYVSPTPDSMKCPEKFAGGLYFETNLSANSIRDSIQKLLRVFSIPDSEIVFYLREDKDPD
jgi:DNA mismatch repair ATPase MutS